MNLCIHIVLNIKEVKCNTMSFSFFVVVMALVLFDTVTQSGLEYTISYISLSALRL